MTTSPQPISQALRGPEWAMALLGYTTERRSAFWQFATNAGLPMVRLGPRKIMFDESQVRDWIAKRSTS